MSGKQKAKRSNAACTFGGRQIILELFSTIGPFQGQKLPFWQHCVHSFANGACKSLGTFVLVGGLTFMYGQPAKARKKAKALICSRIYKIIRDQMASSAVYGKQQQTLWRTLLAAALFFLRDLPRKTTQWATQTHKNMQKLLACSYDKIQPLGKGGILLMLVVLHMCSAHTLLCSRNHFWKLLMCISLGLFSLFLLPLRLQGHKGHKGRVVCKKKRRKLYSFTQRMDVSEVLPHTYPSHVQNLANTCHTSSIRDGRGSL